MTFRLLCFFALVAMACLPSGCSSDEGAEDPEVLRAAVDAVLNRGGVPPGAASVSSATVAVFDRFLNKREGLPMYPGQGDVAFEAEPALALREAAELVPTLEVCGRPDECLGEGLGRRILTLTRPVLGGDRAAVFVLDATAGYLDEYLVTLVRAETEWRTVSVRRTNWEH